MPSTEDETAPENGETAGVAFPVPFLRGRHRGHIAPTPPETGLIRSEFGVWGLHSRGITLVTMVLVRHGFFLVRHGSCPYITVEYGVWLDAFFSTVFVDT